VTTDAIIWTEGKTDSQYIARACASLAFPFKLSFSTVDDMGDDALLKQCNALAKVAQQHPTIFIFDRDNPEIISKITDASNPFKAYGNNVFAFAIPIPANRQGMQAICLELYFDDDDLRIKDLNGRRLFLSSEFNLTSGRHLDDPSLSVGNKGKLAPTKSGSVRVLDTEVYDANSKNVALSKVDFADSIAEQKGAFADVNFGHFSLLLSIVEQIILLKRIDPVFGGLQSFLNETSDYKSVEKLACVVEAAIRMCKLCAMVFIGTTIRHYETTSAKNEINQKRLRPVRQTIIDNFTRPSLTTISKAAKQCVYLVDDGAPGLLQELRSTLASSSILGSLGSLLDDIERIIPPDTTKGRVILKHNARKPLLDYVFIELAKYEARTDEMRHAEDASLDGADSSVWTNALVTLADWLSPTRALAYRLSSIVRVKANSDEFTVKLTTYQDGRISTEEVIREYADLGGDSVYTCEVNASSDGEMNWLEIFPFVTLKDDALHFYARTRAIGYECHSAFGPTVNIVETKRKFSRAALEGTIADDRQVLFWTRSTPALSEIGVKANIPAHDPGEFVGRKQQISTVLDEVIEIPNENGILIGPGGIGKTSLLIELSRKLFEEGLPTRAPFKNVIWVSAKKDYYDPTLDVIEAGAQQFKSLDQILLSMLEFHEFQEPEQYVRDDQRWLIFELCEAEKTLLILDNFETISKAAQTEIVRFFGTEMKRHLITKPDNFKVIITSREMVPSGFHQIQLKGLDKRDSNLLMQRLYQPYAKSGKAEFTEAQKTLLYDRTQGIPLIIKHCYGQVYEFGVSLDVVLNNLLVAGNKVIEFSFAEVFRFLEEDQLQAKIIILLELINRPILVRQMADILAADHASVDQRVTNLLNFQCIVRSSSDIDDKYTINPDAKLLSAKLVHESIKMADTIRADIARLAAEKRIDYNEEELKAFNIFREYLSNGFLAQAEDFIKERLKERPGSILFNLHYAKYLNEQKHQPQEAIKKLEGIRQKSGNAPEVLRLLMTFNTALEPPDFDQAHIYAKELEKYPLDDWEMMMDLAEFYTTWSTSLKLKIELDPIREMQRHQKYKELSDHAISLLKSKPDQASHRWHYLLAQNHFNKWDYDSAGISIQRAIANLPTGSYLENSYDRLKSEIGKKSRRYGMSKK
jgi:hypothetical protein